MLLFISDWSKTSLGESPMEQNKGSMVLPLVLQNFTPNIVAIIGQYNQNKGSMVLPLVLQNFTPNIMTVIGQYNHI